MEPCCGSAPTPPHKSSAPESRPRAFPIPANLAIDAGATIVGATVGDSSVANAGSVILDSSNLTSLDPTVSVGANSLVINTGGLSIELPTLASPIATPLSGLVLSSSTLGMLQQSVQNLALQSYSTFDIWGSGAIGGPAVSGQFPVQNLELHAADIRGFDNGGGTVTINAQTVTLAGLASGNAPGAIQSSRRKPGRQCGDGPSDRRHAPDRSILADDPLRIESRHARKRPRQPRGFGVT